MGHQWWDPSCPCSTNKDKTKIVDFIMIRPSYFARIALLAVHGPAAKVSSSGLCAHQLPLCAFLHPMRSEMAKQPRNVLMLLDSG